MAVSFLPEILMYHYGYGPGWIVVAIVLVVPFWRLCQRVGHSPWLSLLMLLPIANVILLYYIAFAEWPSQRGGTGAGPKPA
jgi:hypothetical protein